MHSLQKQFQDFVQAEELLKEDDHVLLAVSGGLDSMVMADLFCDADWRFEVAHCNFNLRDKESDEDEEFVKSWAKKNEVLIHVKHFDLGEGSIQLNARNARYRWFEQLSREKGFTKIATAHHLDDSLETVLINLSRGTGVRGLGGIPSKADKIIRPLLFTSREHLESYSKKHGLLWREDSSNSKKDYDRNLLRLEVIPKIKELNPSLIDTFRSTAERALLSHQVVHARAEEVKKKYLVVDGSVSELKLHWLKSKADLLLLSEILAEFGFSYFTTKQIFEAKGKPGKQFFASEYVLSIDRDSLFVKPFQSMGDEELSITGVGDFDLSGSSFGVSIMDRKNLDFQENPMIAYLDTDHLTFPIEVRKWKEGDRFVPLGMTGSKKVSDYLIDRKVPLALKSETLVLIVGDQIAWLVGYQISEKFKIGDKTKKVLKIEIRFAKNRETSSD